MFIKSSWEWYQSVTRISVIIYVLPCDRCTCTCTEVDNSRSLRASKQHHALDLSNALHLTVLGHRCLTIYHIDRAISLTAAMFDTDRSCFMWSHRDSVGQIFARHCGITTGARSVGSHGLDHWQDESYAYHHDYQRQWFHHRSDSESDQFRVQHITV